MGKVDSGVQGLGDPFVFRSLRAIVQRERMHPVPERTEERHGRLPEGGDGPSRQGREQGIARAAFHVGDEDPRVPRPDQGIALPVPDPATTFHEGRSGIDADPVFQESPPLQPAMALAPLSLTA
jgi:hypothetical protein